MNRDALTELVRGYAPLLAGCDKQIAAIGLVGSIIRSTWHTEPLGGRPSDIDLFLLYSHTPGPLERHQLVCELLEAWRLALGDRRPAIKRHSIGTSWYLCGHGLDLHIRGSVSDSMDHPKWLWFRITIAPTANRTAPH